MHSVIILSFGALIVVRNPLSLLVPVRFTFYCDPSIILVPTDPHELALHCIRTA